jgi:hypothetical protein
MNQGDSSKTDFTGHYERLGLDDRATWDNAREKYRQLVLRWHPDRFEQKPRERAYAQQQFIEMSKSYKALRTFYRKNHRLPFQSLRAASETKSSQAAADTGIRGDSADGGIFDRTATPAPGARQSKSRRGRIWFAVAASFMVGTVMFFLILDRKTTQAIVEQGRDIVEQSPKSEFMPSTAEIRRSQSRGAFVKLPQ